MNGAVLLDFFSQADPRPIGGRRRKPHKVRAELTAGPGIEDFDITGVTGIYARQAAVRRPRSGGSDRSGKASTEPVVGTDVWKALVSP